ncbi:hypothetical protein CYMTET_40460 [Cymbomonas tetramitiformis]|uniref:Uncharacterized protein n=1 Tax=Cymbomonas tetramitiformis TaxID=36881 RepID=A0AAE0C802_9CHLO|nr:hypothetical protein CYMTET_40460 [Cymbomonas tetramitiformis]
MEWAAPKGSRVWVKVLEIRDDEKIQGGKRISCSMKLVSQEGGADLDKDGKLAKRGFQQGRALSLVQTSDTFHLQFLHQPPEESHLLALGLDHFWGRSCGARVLAIIQEDC